MRRLGLLFLLTLISSTVAVADDKPDPKKTEEEEKGKFVIRWHGQSFFQITTPKGTKVVIDPHVLEQYRMNLKEAAVDADLVLVSHPHTDHDQVQAVKNAEDPKKVKQIWAVDKQTKDWNKLKEEFKDVKIQTIGTYHDRDEGMTRGKNGVFVLDIDGLRIVHLGDLGHVLTEKQVSAIGIVDVLMIPVGGIYTLNGLDAMKVVEQLKPRRLIIPMHFGTIVYDWTLDIKKSRFLDDFKPEQVEIMKENNNKLVLDPKAPVPKEPRVAVMGYFDR